MSRKPAANAWAGLEAGLRRPGPAAVAGAARSALDPIVNLDNLCFAFRVGADPDPTCKAWFVERVSAVFAGRIASFDEAFGCAARQGKKNETARARYLQAVVRRALPRVIGDIPGDTRQKCKTLRLILAAQVAPPSDVSRQALEEIRAEGAHLPRSVENLCRLVVKVTDAKPG